MIAKQTRGNLERVTLLLAVVAGCAAMVVLFSFDPVKSSFYPLCPLHVMTGWSCPGCGTLRALHQLAHGNLVAAWRFNLLAVALLPVAAWLFVREVAWQFFGRAWPGIVTRPAFAWALLGITLIFGIVRNVPGFHS